MFAQTYEKLEGKLLVTLKIHHLFVRHLTCKANLFTTHEAPILLGFGGLGGFGVFTASSGGMRG